jgi:YebC/PmpR family DNA-binding regulatory protein
MSGHSKWATIHRQKETKDAKRGAIFTKLAAQIIVAVRQGGGIGDPDKNFRLRLAMDKARQFNMPKENMARAIEHGMGAGEGAQVVEVVYEGFLPGGLAVMVEALTDNKARTAQQVRAALEKGGGSLGGSGAVGYLFSPKGEIRVKLQARLPDGQAPKSPQDQELEIIDLGVEEIEQDGDGFDVYCDREKTYEVKERLESLGYEVESIELVMKPEVWVKVALDDRQKVEVALEQLEELDDVAKVWTNYQPEAD